jgi:hypothetical protein
LRKLLVPLLALTLGAAILLYLQRDRARLWTKTHLVHPLDTRGSLDRTAVSKLLGSEQIEQNVHFDPVTILRPHPDRSRTWKWPEHPEGHIVLRTNDRGFHELEPTAPVKRGPRILIAGDSHTAGLVTTHESFANVLERELGELPTWTDVEVINAGCAYTGPFSYLGVLRKYLSLRPDVFVAVFFGGNDPWDDLRLDYYLRGWSPPSPGTAYLERGRAAAARWPGPMYQGFNLAHRWRAFPHERERALEVVVESFVAMRDLCEEQGIRFLTVALPTKMDVDEDDLEVRESVRQHLRLEPADLDALEEERQRFMAALARHGIPCLDPAPAMREVDEPLYWRRDYHLNVAGHALVAGLLRDELSPDG